jgi:hypothetical protein
MSDHPAPSLPHEQGSDPHHAPSQTAHGLHRFLEASSTFLFPLQVAYTMFEATQVLHDAGALWALALVVPLAWAASDAFTGVIHWMFDTYWCEDTPVIGSTFIQPFREHHVLPKNICNHDLISTLGNSCIGGVPTQGALMLWVTFADLGPWSAGLIVFLSMTFAGAALTNLFHKWAHADNNPGWIKGLQAARLILPPQHHGVHHTAPHDNYYGITCGWTNALLKALHFYRALEVMLRWVGVRPHAEVVGLPHAEGAHADLR